MYVVNDGLSIRESAIKQPIPLKTLEKNNIPNCLQEYGKTSPLFHTICIRKKIDVLAYYPLNLFFQLMN